MFDREEEQVFVRAASRLAHAIADANRVQRGCRDCQPLCLLLTTLEDEDLVRIVAELTLWGDADAEDR